MIGFIHRGVPAARVGFETVLLEAGAGVLVRGLHHDVDAPTQITEDQAAVALQARYDLDHAVALEHASSLAAAQHMRQVIDAAGRKPSPSAGTSRLVALAIAAISIADLVPSRNELNI